MAISLIANFSEVATVTRFDGSGSYVSGEWVAGTTSDFDIDISMQPLNGREIQILPEGMRTRRVMKGYTATRLFTAKEPDAKQPDTIDYDGTVFEVHNVERWRGDLNFFKVVLVEVDNE